MHQCISTLRAIFLKTASARPRRDYQVSLGRRSDSGTTFNTMSVDSYPHKIYIHIDVVIGFLVSESLIYWWSESCKERNTLSAVFIVRTFAHLLNVFIFK